MPTPSRTPPKGKTWRQKLQETHPNHGKVVPLSERQQKRFGKGKMIIPSPLDVQARMKQVRKGRLITQAQLANKLATEAGVKAACPLVTGIFVRIVAEAAEEDRRDGRKRITPWWRTIKSDGTLNPKFPGGVRAQARLLREEGFTVSPAKGAKAPRVKDYQDFLVAG